MGNIISITEKIVGICKKHNYFNALTLFVKTECHNKRVVLIAIGKDNETLSPMLIDGMEYTICYIEQSDCYSQILRGNSLFAEMFNQTLCLKDELNIAPVLLSAIKPLLKSVPALPEIGTLSYFNHKRYRKKELAIRFNGILDIDEFISKTFIPLSSSLKNYLSKANLIFQYDSENGNKSLAIIYVFEENVTKSMQIDIQKYLYLHFSELNLRNIDIPYRRPYNALEGMPGNIMKNVMKSLGTLTSSFLVQNEKSVSENKKVTTLVYLYIITAKTIFNHYRSFIECNEHIYNYYLKEKCSDTLYYVVNNHLYTNALSKIEKEFYILSLTNIQVLYANYQPLLSKWNIIENDDNYNLYIAQMYYLKSTLKGNVAPFFHEYVKLLFACYDVSTYYKAYIPYIIKYLNNEI